MTKDYITRSFTRCKEYGLDPAMIYSRRILRGSELEERLKKNKELIVIAEPFIRQLCDFLKGTGFFSILTDEEGCILKVIGDEDILGEAYALKMIPGAFMDEENIGTNAMGTALAERFAVQVSGEEHFIKEYHRWTCSGAPIRDSDDRIVGSLDLTGNTGNVNKHTLGMVVAAVNAIEKTLKLRKSNEQLMNSNLFIEKLMDSIQAGIISCNLEGEIQTTNSQISDFLGVDKGALLFQPIESVIPAWNEIRRAAVAGEDFQNRDLPLNTGNSKVYFNVNAYPVSYNNGSITGVIITVKDVKRIRKHANDIIGRKAIYTFDKMVGVSEAFTEAVDFAKKVADSNSTILITGESGTGKEIFAQSIHNYSGRRDEAFVVLNCGAIPRTLIESELFGYKEGSFTGARKGGQAGKFEIADGGTLFLDEIGEMPLDMQVKLLRVIEEGVVTRLGGHDYIPVNVRIIAATNKDLTAEVQDGLFRKDLFYRLNVLPIRLPALRERPEDIPLLIDFYSKKLSRKINKREVDISPAQMRAFCTHTWPGNIRELENMMELIIISEKIPSSFPFNQQPDIHSVSKVVQESPSPALEEVEESHIRRVLEENDYNITVSAKKLGIGRNTLYRRIQSYKIDCS
jgi:transcriptional regulator of acetoin/glycerol metabolism